MALIPIFPLMIGGDMMTRFKIQWQYGGYFGTSDIKIDSKFVDSDLEWLNTQSFWLFEGNGCCDCNRGGWLCGDGFEWETGEIGGSNCGDEIIFTCVEFYRDGRYIGDGSDMGWYILGE